MVNIVGVGGTLRENSKSYYALEIAMDAAQAEGAETEIFSLDELNLPMFVPYKKESEWDENVQRLMAAFRRADGIILSTGAYHGTLAGATKNMLDFVELMHNDTPSFFHNRAVGLIATAGGTMAGVNTVNTLIHTVHALRGVVVPLTVPIPSASKAFQDDKLVDEGIHNRLKQLAHETVRLAQALHPVAIET